MRKVVSLLMALVMTLSVCSVTAWAEGDAVQTWSETNSLPTSGVYKLAEDVTVSETVMVSGDLTIDLNGKAITGQSGDAGRRVFHVAAGGNLTLAGTGVVTTAAKNDAAFTDNSSVIRVGGDAGDKSALTIGSGVKVTAPASYGVTIFGINAAELTVNGTVESDTTCAISGNGSAKYGETVITINGGAVVASTNAVAIYHPQNGKLTIGAATITGKGGVEVKSGDVLVNVDGAMIQATGAVSHEKNNNGTSTSGYAVAVVENSGYKGAPKFNIEKGTFIGPVEIVADDVVADANKAALTISGGTFSDLSAVKYAATGAKISFKLENDVTDNVVIPHGADVTIDLNGHKIVNKDGHTITVQMGAALTVNGTGTVDNVTHGKAAIYNNGVVTLNGGTYERSAEAGTDKDHSGGNSFYTILNHGFMVVNDGVVVKNKGHFSSLFENGYYNYKSGNEASGYVDGTNEEKPELALNGGTFDGGLNTIKNDDNATLTINGGTFKNYTQACVQNHHIASITNGTFTGEKVHAVLNCGAKNCGIVEGHDEHVMTISGGTFKGGIAKTFGTLAVTGGTFSDGNPLPYVDADHYAVTKNVNDEYVVSEKSHGDDGTTATDSVVVIEANASTTDKEMVSKTIDKSDIHTDMELVVKTASGDEKKQTSVTLNQAAVAAVGSGEDLTLTVKDVTAETKASDDKNSAAYGKGMSGKKADSALVVQVELKKGSDKVFTTKTDNAYADVSVFYGKGLAADKVHVYYLNGSSIQELTSVAALSGVDQFAYDRDTGVVTMRLAHFSEYLIATETTTSGGGSSGGGTASIPVTSGNGQNKKAGDVVSVTMQSGSKVAVVYVDGVALSAKDYVVSGSSVRVQGTYTAKLAQGTHVLHVVYNDGRTATATFTINGSTSPKTFDAGVAVYVGMALMSVTGGALVIGKKKEF